MVHWFALGHVWYHTAFPTADHRGRDFVVGQVCFRQGLAIGRTVKGAVFADQNQFVLCRNDAIILPRYDFRDKEPDSHVRRLGLLTDQTGKFFPKIEHRSRQLFDIGRRVIFQHACNRSHELCGISVLPCLHKEPVLSPNCHYLIAR